MFVEQDLLTTRTLLDTFGKVAVMLNSQAFVSKHYTRLGGIMDTRGLAVLNFKRFESHAEFGVS